MHASIQNSRRPRMADLSRSAGGRSVGPFVLHFQSLIHAGRGFTFPCDEDGQVDLDAMADTIRNDYLYARAMLGREFAWPCVCSVRLHRDPAASAPPDSWQNRQ